MPVSEQRERTCWASRIRIASRYNPEHRPPADPPTRSTAPSRSNPQPERSPPARAGLRAATPPRKGIWPHSQRVRAGGRTIPLS